MTPQSLKTIKDTIDNAQHVCLFGIGALLHDCFHQLVSFLGREPDFLCDNAWEKWGREFFGKQCISPDELGKLRGKTVVIITVRNYESIYQQLNRMGIKDVFISCYDRCYNAIDAVKRLDGDQFEALNHESTLTPVRGKWTLITGAARGIGRQIAMEMAKRGSNIIAHSRSVSHVKETVDLCNDFGVQVVPIAAELGNLTEVEEMLSRLECLVPHIDIVFNNAAISSSWPAGFWSVPVQDYLSTYTINTVTPILICKRLLQPMIQRGFGRIVNITSSIQRRPGEMAYACSKAALDKFVYDLAPSLQGTGVTITLLDPGWLRTDMGGLGAPHSLESVIPGALLGVLLDCNFNGRWFSAQDYAGLSAEAAIQKARFLSASSPVTTHEIKPEPLTLEVK